METDDQSRKEQSFLKECKSDKEVTVADLSLVRNRHEDRVMS